MYYIQALDYDCWKVIVKGPHIPTKMVGTVKVPKNEDEWTADKTKLIQLNAKAISNLYCALSPQEYNRVSACDPAKKI